MSEPAQPQPTNPDQTSRADPAFKRITQELAAAVGLKLIGAEPPQTLTADMVLEIPGTARLEDSLFSFLRGYSYAVLDFKGQADNLDIDKFLVNVARTALFCSRRPGATPEQVLNLIVSARYPQELLNLAGADLTNSAEQPWLWHSRNFYQQVAIVVCRDLPLEPAYYEWLAFAPADTEAWRSFVRQLLREGRRSLLELIKSMRPKEFLAMNISEVLADLDPEEQIRLEQELAEGIEGGLKQIAKRNPQMLLHFLTEIQELVQQLENEGKIDHNSIQTAEQNQDGDAPAPEQENPE